MKSRCMIVCASLFVFLLAAHLFAAQGVINVNTATVEQLMMLPGIGEKTAKAIVSYRQAHGQFKTVDDLARVKGIGMKKVNALRPNLAVQGQNTYVPDAAGRKSAQSGAKTTGS